MCFEKVLQISWYICIDKTNYFFKKLYFLTTTCFNFSINITVFTYIHNYQFKNPKICLTKTNELIFKLNKIQKDSKF